MHFVSGSECLPLPVWHGMIVDATDRSAGSKVNVTCQKGKHMLASGEKIVWLHLKCLDTGHWYPTTPQCVGKCLENVLMHLFYLYILLPNLGTKFTLPWHPLFSQSKQTG